MLILISNEMNRLSGSDWRFASGAPGGQWWHYVLVAIPHIVSRQIYFPIISKGWLMIEY
jgi:hypothetical protein